MNFLARMIGAIVIGLFIVITPVFLWGSFSYDVVAQEEDEDREEEEDKEDDEDEREDEKKSDESSTTETVVTERITISETVSKEVVTTTRKDTDGDGIFDEQDDYPQINDHFIVKDDDHNGIVDTYEEK